MGESFQCRGSGKGEGEGLLGMWLGIELVGKESVCVRLHHSNLQLHQNALAPLITTEESKISFIILKYISLLCKT